MNNISFQSRGYNVSFNGTIHRSAQNIFKNLCNDIQSFENYQGKTITSKDVYEKISDYMAKTDKDTELFWKKSSFLNLFKLHNYEGFMFRNKATKKEIYGSKYPIFSDFNVYHPSEKYIDDLGVTAQAPILKSRKEVSGYKSPFIENIHEYFNGYERFVVGGESYYKKRSPILGLFTGMLRKIIGCFPHKKIIPYDISELYRLNRWVEELTTHTKPSDIDRLLGIIK